MRSLKRTQYRANRRRQRGGIPVYKSGIFIQIFHPIEERDAVTSWEAILFPDNYLPA